VVLSGDGLPLGRSAELDREGAEHLAAMASAFSSLSRGVGERFGKGGMLQTVVELEDGYLVVTEAGPGACLALFASSRTAVPARRVRRRHDRNHGQDHHDGGA
jgi:predicted regulator of Ras-like GTPase activity (Roadblock/LC7/MglB family)